MRRIEHYRSTEFSTISFYKCTCTCINIYIYIFFFFNKVFLVTTVDHTEIIDLGILIPCLSKMKANFINLSKEHKS